MTAHSPSEYGRTVFGQPAPILLLGFNRPEMLRGLVCILAKARPPKLYLAVDGPREEHPGEAEKCAECSAVLDNLGWPCEVKKLIREKNLGCRMGVSSALDWFFENEEEGIILEDDCWPDISFLRFATELLERYRDDSRVGMVSGNNHYGFISDKGVSYRFSCDYSIWGWATWRRSWFAARDFGVSLEDRATCIISKTKQTSRGVRMGLSFWHDYLDSRSTWDTPFGISLAGLGMFAIVPCMNLVANRGWGAGGTHTGGFSYDRSFYLKAAEMPFPLKHPDGIFRDVAADRLHELRAFALFPRVLTVVGQRFGVVGKAMSSLAHLIERFCPSMLRL